MNFLVIWFQAWFKDPKNRILLFSILALALVASFLGNKSESEKSTVEAPEEIEISTLIPKDSTMIPIELANQESFSSFVKDFVLVDLYISTPNGRRGQKRLAKEVKIFRAPYNPDKFAVMVPSHMTDAIAAQTNPIFAVIRNPTNQAAESLDVIPAEIPITYHH